MIVQVSEALFGRPDLELHLSALLLLGLERHALITAPLWGDGATPHLDRWLDQRSPRLRDDVELILEIGLDHAARHAERRIRITPRERSDWDNAIPALTLTDGLNAMMRPLALLLENRFGDGVFLERSCALGVPHAQWLLDRLQDGWIVFEQGGGITEMCKRIRHANPTDRLRLWCMSDSDAPEPNQPSQEAQDIRDACAKHRVRYHMLERRAIENYLPTGTLYRALNAAEHPRVRAFAQMTPAQRHHFPMKTGLPADLAHPNNALYHPPAPTHDGPCLDPAAHQHLQAGFGRKIADEFNSPRHSSKDWQRWASQDPDWRAEAARILASIRRSY